MLYVGEGFKRVGGLAGKWVSLRSALRWHLCIAPHANVRLHLEITRFTLQSAYGKDYSHLRSKLYPLVRRTLNFPGSEPVLETQIRVIPSFSTLTVMKFGAKKFFVVGTVQSICRIKHPITH